LWASVKDKLHGSAKLATGSTGAGVYRFEFALHKTVQTDAVRGLAADGQQDVSDLVEKGRKPL
jgi:O-acetyl-ADP-ribose deacetylase (regulator of RNase III)